MKSISELLGEHAFFADFSPDIVELLAGCGELVHYAVDDRILAADDPADRFYAIRTGMVAVELHTPRGGTLILETIGPDEVLGVSWLLPPYRWTFDARAVASTSAIALDAACLRAKCDADPAVGYAVFKQFAGLVRDRLQATRMQLIDVYGSHDS